MRSFPPSLDHSISDEDLLEYLRTPQSAEAAFGLLIDRYSRSLYAVIRRIVLSHESADDVLQNTLIKVWTRIAQFRGQSKLSTWLYSIATNEALSHLRSERSRAHYPLETDEYDLSQTLMSDPYFDGDEVEATFIQAIDRLPEKQKITFQLRYFEDLPYSEISQITGTSIGALKANYHHALHKLKQYIDTDLSLD